MKNFLLVMGLFVLNCFGQPQVPQDFTHSVSFRASQSETPTQRRLAPLEDRFEKMVEKRWEFEIEKHKSPKWAQYAVAGMGSGMFTTLVSFIIPNEIVEQELLRGIGIFVMIASGFLMAASKDRNRVEAICAGRAELCDLLSNNLVTHKERIECDLKNEYKSGNLMYTQEGKAFLEHMETVIAKFKEELRTCRQDDDHSE